MHEDHYKIVIANTKKLTLHGLEFITLQPYASTHVNVYHASAFIIELTHVQTNEFIKHYLAELVGAVLVNNPGYIINY